MKPVYFSFLFWLGILPVILNAQDSHYWTLQYGPKSSLLGGAVIGSINDISATYYNPGALALSEKLAFAVSVDVFEFSTLSLQDGGGQGVDLGTNNTGLRPSFLAGTIKKDLGGKGGVLAYSLLTRAKGSQDLQGAIFLSGDEIPTDLSLEEVFALSRFEGQFDDLWAGVSFSQPLGEHFGLGATWYGALRSQRRRREAITEFIDQGRNSGGAIIDIAGGNYTTVRTLLKLGASAQFGPFSAGLTLTTPSLHIGGQGELGLNQARFAQDTAALAANLQPDLKAKYKSPLSVGFGLGYRIGKATLHASAEWFQRIDPYFVMQGESFNAQEPAEQLISVDAVQEQDQVFNWALGFEYAFKPKVNGYLSFNTDQSALTSDVERASLSIIPININNFNLGADFTIGRILLTLGAGYGWGSKVDQELTDLLQREDEDFEATFVYRNIRLILGFEIGLNRNREE